MKSAGELFHQITRQPKLPGIKQMIHFIKSPYANSANTTMASHKIKNTMGFIIFDFVIFVFVMQINAS